MIFPRAMGKTVLYLWIAAIMYHSQSKHWVLLPGLRIREVLGWRQAWPDSPCSCFPYARMDARAPGNSVVWPLWHFLSFVLVR